MPTSISGSPSMGQAGKPAATAELASHWAPDAPPAGVASVGALRRLAIPLCCILLAAALVALTVTRWDSWRSQASVQVTDDAVVRTELTRLSSRVGGSVKRVAVKDFQHVRSGDLLMEIDPADYDAVVGQARAGVAAAQATLSNLENQKANQRGLNAEAEANLLSALARMTEARQEQERQDTLLRSGIAGTRQRVEQATAAHIAARAAVAAGEAAIEAQRGQLEVLNGQEALLRANLQAAEAALTAAQLRLSYTRIVAPFDGVVGERQVQEGDYVNIGTNLITVVPLPNVYVTANYKETQLTHVASGQPVDVTADMFPDTVLHGRVVRIAPASGSTFALLPPDNATGNFTKVTQRIPVRIEFDPDQSLIEHLRPGMSVVTRIHVRDASAQTIAQGEMADSH